jgi:3-oxoacyl-[acyl-carrier protein] reductase
LATGWDIGHFTDFVGQHGHYSALVVGAGSGIGRAAAERLGQLGVSVGCLDRDGEAASATAATIAAAGGRSMAVSADVTDAFGIERAVADAIAGLEGLHAVVNCAGVSGPTTNVTHEVSLEDFDAVLAINLRGALVVSRAVLPHLLAQGYGRVLHVASIAGKEGNARMAPYSTSKAGLIGLVKVMGKEYAETGVTVNALAPAVIQTPLVAALPEQTIRYMTDKIPMRRCGELAEVASMIAWIVSPSCSFTTGFTFDLTGGRATY